MHEPLPHRSAPATGVAHTLHRDYETRSNANLPKVGVDKYAADPSTEVLCAAYAVDDGPVQVWLPGREPIPAVFIEAERDLSWEVSAHNDAFETAIERHVLAPRFGFPFVPLERHSCTMARCQALALPARLGAVADVLELANRKDADGERLMQQMSKPRPAGTHDDPGQLAQLGRYCKQDVETERELHGRVPPLPAEEQTLWVISCRINQRGFYFDRSFAEAARRIAQAAAPEIDAELAELTGGAVTKASQVASLRRWLQQQGCTMENLNRKTVEKLLGDDALAAPVRRVLELRLGGAQAAVKKIDALFACADSDDRVRGVFRYHGAATGRFSGERFQPQNLKRPTVEDLDAAIAAVATGDIAHVKKLYPKPLAIVGDCIRSMICAAPGHVLYRRRFQRDRKPRPRCDRLKCADPAETGSTLTHNQWTMEGQNYERRTSEGRHSWQDQIKSRCRAGQRRARLLRRAGFRGGRDA